MKKITTEGTNKNLLAIIENTLQTLNKIRPYIQESEECFTVYSFLSMTLSSIQIELTITLIPIEIVQRFLVDCINNAKSLRRQTYKYRTTHTMNLTPVQIKFLWQITYFGGTLKNLEYSDKNIFSYLQKFERKLGKISDKIMF